MTPDEAAAILADYEFWARDKQLEPPALNPSTGVDWLYWVLICGRGFGKTWTGSNWVNKQAKEGSSQFILIAGRTATDTRSFMIEGKSGILATAPPGFRPEYEPSKMQITWPNGVIGVVRYGEKPPSFRGFEGSKGWLDELFFWKDGGKTAMEALIFGMREAGTTDGTRILITSSPSYAPYCDELCEDEDAIVVQGGTDENAANLDPRWLAKMHKRFDGTETGERELGGHRRKGNPSASWKPEWLFQNRIEPDVVGVETEQMTVLRNDVWVFEDVRRLNSTTFFQRIVLGFDPGKTCGPKSDESGMVIAGLGHDGHGYVLADLSRRCWPHEWAAVIAAAVRDWSIDTVVVEDNALGDSAETILKSADSTIPLKRIPANRSKVARAAPIAAEDARGRIHQVGRLPEMEGQMVNRDLRKDGELDDRLDARVIALTELMLDEDDLAAWGAAMA